MAKQQKTKAAELRDKHKETTAKLIELDPQTHPAEWREAFRDYLRTTDALTTHVLGENGEE
jgi:nitrate reductase assembly molybdenum cofactor insertion protein NarJ